MPDQRDSHGPRYPEEACKGTPGQLFGCSEEVLDEEIEAMNKEPFVYLYTDLGFDICVSPHKPGRWEGPLVELPWADASAHLHHYPTQIVRFTRRDQSYPDLAARLQAADE